MKRNVKISNTKADLERISPRLQKGETRFLGENPQTNFFLMIKLSSYNIRGLNKKPKQAYIKKFIADSHISFVGLIETRVKKHKAFNISKALCKSWSWFFNYDSHYNGRIWVGWDPSIWKVEILFSSSQLVHCKLDQISSSLSCYVSIVYGLNNSHDRKSLWNDLQSFATSSCWCLLGDFNVIKSLSENEGGENSWNQGMDDFNDCLESIGLDDIRGVGSFFTWRNCQDISPILRKLDRALGNSAWMNQMTNAQAIYAPRGLSDHNPIILDTGIHLAKVKKPFQFFNYMLQLERVF